MSGLMWIKVHYHQNTLIGLEFSNFKIIDQKYLNFWKVTKTRDLQIRTSRSQHKVTK